jgi:tetratricopeptide (TPR) repeat protein
MHGERFNLAITPLKKAIHRKPKGTLKITLAQAYFYLRQYDNAKAVLNEVLGNNPDNEQALMYQGMMLKELGDTTGAMRSFQKAVQSNSRNAEANMYLGLLNARRKNQIALQYFDNVIKVDSNYNDAYLAKATFLIALKRDAAAKKVYRTLIARSPFDVDAIYNLGFLYMDEDSIPKAFKYFDMCVNAKHDFADAYYNRGVCRDLLGKHKEAIDDYKQTLILDPGTTLAKEALAKDGVK